MKKKYLTGILVIACVLSLCACGKQMQSGEPEEAPQVQTEAEEQQETEAPAEEAEKEESTEAEDAAAQEQEENALRDAFLQVGVSHYYESANDDQNNRYQVVKVEYDKVELLNGDAQKYAALQNTLTEKYEQDKASAEAEFQDMSNMYFEYETDSDFYAPYEETWQCAVLRADPTVLCILSNYYGYMGGAHGYYSITGYTYDAASGKSLFLADVVKDEAACKDLIREKVLEQCDEDYLFIDGNYFDDLAFADETLSWSMDYNGVTIYFNPYEIASYADGIIEARISFAEAPGIFDEKYTQTPEAYVEPLTTWAGVYADIDRNGKEEKLALFGVTDEWDWTTWTYRIGEESVEAPIQSFSNSSYLVHNKDKNYVYMFTTQENDYEVLSIMDVDSRSFVNNNVLENSGLPVKYDGIADTSVREEFTNPHAFQMESRLELLSTYNGGRLYHVGEDGMPVSDEAMYHTASYYLIKNKRDINCSIIDAEGNILQENAVLPAGSLCRIIGCDKKNLVDVQAADYAYEEGDIEWPYWYTNEPLDLSKGTFYRIRVEIDDNFRQTVDGEEIYNVFDGMMFAG